MMRRSRHGALSFLILAGCGWLASPNRAQNVSVSSVDLRISAAGMDAAIWAPVNSLANYLSSVRRASLFTQEGLDRQKGRIGEILASGLVITAQGRKLRAEPGKITAVPEQQAFTFHLHYSWKRPPDAITVRCELFPVDYTHKTYMNLYEDGRLARQEIFDIDHTRITYRRPVPPRRLSLGEKLVAAILFAAASLGALRSRRQRRIVR